MQQSSAAIQNQQESLRRLNRVVIYMVIYPVAYVILSLPLAAGRMSVSRGIVPSKTYFAVAGAFMALSGCVDVIVYTVTRRHLLLDSDGSIPTQTYSYQRNDSKLPGTSVSTVIAAGKGKKPKRSKFGSRFRTTESFQMDTIDSGGDRDLSTDDIVMKVDRERGFIHTGVYQETTIEIVHEPAVEDGSESSISSMRKTKRNSGIFE
jgi:G protein-coupled glucose receptor regulating Gpa2 C-term